MGRNTRTNKSLETSVEKTKRKPVGGTVELRPESGQDPDPLAREISSENRDFLNPYKKLPRWAASIDVGHELILPVLILVLLVLVLLASTGEAIVGRDLSRTLACFSIQAEMRLRADDVKSRISEGSAACKSMSDFFTGESRALTGPEMQAVYTAIDALRDVGGYKELGDVLMANSHRIRVAEMEEDVRGSTPFFTQGGFILNEGLVLRVVDSPTSPTAVAELASTLAHEYIHTQQLGAGKNPFLQSFHQFTYGAVYAISLPMEWSGFGPRDQNGQGHGFFEIRPWRVAIDVENAVFNSMQRALIDATTWN